MIISHNISALNTLNRLRENNKNTATAMEKLSSGLRINKASDNAAGLAISEKMRAQVRGLQQAQRNTQDGISLIQTAEGGLASIQNPPLQRLRELAIQSSNDTLTDTDRQEIQKEVEQIKKGINKIANNTEFNGIALLNVTEKTKATNTLNSYESSPSVVELSNAQSITIYENTVSNNELTFSISELKNGVTWSTLNSGVVEEYVFSVDITSNTFTTRAKKGLGKEVFNNVTGVRVNELQGYDKTEVWASNLVSTSGSPGDPLDSNHSLDKILGDNLSDTPDFGINETTDTTMTVNFEAKKEKEITTSSSFSSDLSLQTGANSTDSFPVELTDARTKALGIDDIDLSTRQGAESAIPKVDQALEKVSSERGKFGAYQNRLEHTLNNLSNYETNLTSAESRIRDADMAKQIMALTKSQILSQASQAMLTQARQQPQQILQLLK